MIPAAFDYRRAASTEEAISMLVDNPDAKLLAGGHSLLPMMRLRLAMPAMLIDIAGIDELRGICHDGDDLVIGALATHAEVATSEEVAAGHRAIAEAAASIGDVQVRNCGTLGGSLAHADPSADYPAAVTAFGAIIEVAGPDGRRSIPIAEFFSGLLTTSLHEHEIVISVRFPASGGAVSAYEKFAQPASGYAMVGVAAVLRMNGGVCDDASLVATGVSDGPQRLSEAEAALAGHAIDDASLASCVDAAGNELGDVRSDLYAAEDYRRHLLGVVTGRAVQRAAS